jgi:hypothetical protein
VHPLPLHEALPPLHEPLVWYGRTSYAGGVSDPVAVQCCFVTARILAKHKQLTGEMQFHARLSGALGNLTQFDQ